MAPMEVLMRSKFWIRLLVLGAWSLTGLAAHAATPADLLAAYAAQSGGKPSVAQGQQFFTSRHGGEWSCASCHGASATQDGKHASTGKLIRPLAPAFNPQRFTDADKAEKWFKRNCKDVLSRECLPAEKADILAWLMTLKP